MSCLGLKKIYNAIFGSYLYENTLWSALHINVERLAITKCNHHHFQVFFAIV